jgi:4-diphosphocytidyl-2-C-methyl-D-erythritol kinase
MIIFAPAKINIGLYVTSKREDGFHNIETVFYPIPLYDVVEIIESSSFSFTEHGIRTECDAGDNLCFKAWKLLKTEFQIPQVEIFLFKNIPVQAGLGGGSSDAAAVLWGLNAMFQLNLSEEKMLSYALQLGSDCPFFLQPVPSLGTSRGEKLTPLNISLKGKTLVIVKPPFGISTGNAFSQVSVKEHGQLLNDISQPLNTWKNNVKNHFECVFHKQNPEMKHIVDKFYSNGAEYVSMSGSGSAFYAIYEEPVPVIPDLPSEMLVRTFRMTK